jgi:hypothetical protein
MPGLDSSIRLSKPFWESAPCKLILNVAKIYPEVDCQVHRLLSVKAYSCTQSTK